MEKKRVVKLIINDLVSVISASNLSVGDPKVIYLSGGDEEIRRKVINGLLSKLVATITDSFSMKYIITDSSSIKYDCAINLNYFIKKYYN